MATFGADYYLRSKYGSRRSIDYGVDPFTATAVTYDSVRLEWNQPSGSWSKVRLVRSRSGYPVNEDDGVVLYESSASAAEYNYTDSDLQGGWVYYSIFLYNDVRGDWERASTVDTILSYDFKSTKKLWDLVPDYYKQIRDNSADFNQGLYQINPAIYLTNEQSVPNQQLLSFLHVFGYSFDRLRSEIDTIRDAYDPRNVHQKRLALLAEQFGGEIYADVPAQNNRSIVRNLGLLYRQRGTTNGLRELIELATGYEVEVSIGKNLMLSEDQAEFVHPQVPLWDPHTRYVAGDIVKYGTVGPVYRYYQAKQTAYGPNQAPELGAFSNAYWDHDKYLNDEDQSANNAARRADTGDMSTWQIKVDGGAVIPEATFIGQSTADPIDGTLANTNSLGFRNQTGSIQDIIVRSIPVKKDEAAILDRKLAVESGIPIPRVPTKWVAGTYHRGDMVTYRGVPYEALAETTSTPTDTTYWKRLGLDDRVRLNFSMYVHGKFAGTAGLGSIANVAPYVMLFDASGNLLLDKSLTSGVTTSVVYDSFYDEVALNSSRTAQIGPTWSIGVSTWNAGWNDDGYYRYPGVGTRSYWNITGSADGSAAVTFAYAGTREIGIQFRYSSSTAYWFATKTGLKKVVAGVDTDPAGGAVTWPTFQTGDRMTVTFVGSTITVKKNGATIATVTDSFNSTANRHGVFAKEV